MRHSNPGSFEFKISVRQGVAKFLRDRVPCAVDDHRCGPNRAFLPHTEREAAGSEGTKLDCDTETVIFCAVFNPAGNVTELFVLETGRLSVKLFFYLGKTRKTPPKSAEVRCVFLGVKRQFICGF